MTTRVPEFIAATALAWTRCVAKFWMNNPKQACHANKAKCIFRELIRYSVENLLHIFDTLSDKNFRMSLVEILENNGGNNSVDQLVRRTIHLTKQRITKNVSKAQILPEVDAIENVLFHALEYAMNQEGMNANGLGTNLPDAGSPYNFVAFELIG